MTVCIGLICKEKVDKVECNRIVVATDWRVSSVLGSAETRFKQHHLTNYWACACSGTNGDILALVNCLRRSLRGAKDHIDETNIKPLVNEALNQRKYEKADEYIHGRFAISYKDFLEFGKEKLPPDVHREAILNVSDISLGAQAIVFGFIGEQFPMMIETTERCSSHIRDDMAVIGEGGYLAQTALLQRQYMHVSALGEAIYSAYEAKRYAERVGSVGNTTTIAIYGYRQPIRNVSDKGIKLLEQKFDNFGPHLITDDVSEVEQHLEI